MNKLIPRLAAFLLPITLIVAACAPDPTSEPTDAPPAASTTTVPSDTPEPTETAVPVSETPAPTETFTATPTPTETQLATGPINFPANVNPLTGLVIADPSRLDRNPVMIKISNFPRGLRPHTGLSFADIVFEHYIGVGATRFTAIYYGNNPDDVGPVRSARLIDAQIGRAYNAIFAFASADQQVYTRVLNALGDRAISESQVTCPALCRTGNGDVNSVFGHPELLTEFAEEERGIVPSRPNLNGMRFDPAAPETAMAGTEIQVLYANTTVSEWRYDPASGLYLRFIDSIDDLNQLNIVPLADAATAEQLTAANVLVLFADTDEIKPTLHDFELLGNFQGRRAILFRDGQAYDLIWRAQGPAQPLQFFTLDGDLIAFKPGNTWIHVVGVTSSVDVIEVTGEWEIFNLIP